MRGRPGHLTTPTTVPISYGMQRNFATAPAVGQIQNSSNAIQ
ncbi:unnamed protein product [Ectocarpus sp. CCAP 1310/34]|nr:unnamed protein product [Ectocarpus sp. CCAP 1310/34]